MKILVYFTFIRFNLISIIVIRCTALSTFYLLYVFNSILENVQCLHEKLKEKDRESVCSTKGEIKVFRLHITNNPSSLKLIDVLVKLFLFTICLSIEFKFKFSNTNNGKF